MTVASSTWSVPSRYWCGWRGRCASTDSSPDGTIHAAGLYRSDAGRTLQPGRPVDQRGGRRASTLLPSEGVGGAPGLVFRTIRESGEFVGWVLAQVEAFRRVAVGTPFHRRLEDLRLAAEGTHAYLRLEFKTVSLVSAAQVISVLSR